MKDDLRESLEGFVKQIKDIERRHLRAGILAIINFSPKDKAIDRIVDYLGGRE